MNCNTYFLESKILVLYEGPKIKLNKINQP